MVTEDESVLFQVSESYNYTPKSDIKLYLKLEDLEKEIWCFIYLTTTKNYLFVMNENLKGKILRRVYKKALAIIDSNHSFLDCGIYIIKQYDL